MKITWQKNLLFSFITVIFILALSALRAYVDHLPFLVAFDRIINTGLNSLWILVSTPTIFVTIAAILLLWLYRSTILSILPGIKEFKAGPVSATFSNFPSPELTSPISTQDEKKIDDVALLYELTKDKKYLEKTAIFFSKNTCDFLLGLDQQTITYSSLVQRFEEAIKGTPVEKTAPQALQNRKFFFEGSTRAFMRTLFRLFIDWKIDEDDPSAACITVNPIGREVLEARSKKLSKAVSSKS